MLEEIIGSVDFEFFLAEIFEKKPLLTRDISTLTKLFSLVDFDKYLIAGEGFLQDLVKISSNGKSISIPSCSLQATTQREFILDQFKSGATLKLEKLESRHTEIAKLCKKLESIFGGYVFAKPFLTGSNFAGLRPHFDTTEVFVIQMEGRKKWQVWNKIIENPTLPMQKSLSQANLGSAVIDTVLEAGDTLYIPAGTPHAAKCLDTYSLHMAIGLQPIKMFEVLEGYLRLMSENISELRLNIYPFSNQKTLENNAQNLIKRMVKIPFQTMQFDFDIAYNATKCETSDERLFSLARIKNINAKTRLRVRKDANILVRYKKDSMEVYFSSTISPGKPIISTPSNLMMPIHCQEEIQTLRELKENIFSPEDLHGKLNIDSKIILCKKLIDVGIVIVE